MPVSFSKSIDLVLYAWTIPWSDSLYLATKHGASVKSGSKYIMYIFICICDPAASLCLRLFGFKKGKAHYFIISRLLFHFSIIKAPTVYPGWRPCFQTITFKSQGNQLFSYTC